MKSKVAVVVKITLLRSLSLINCRLFDNRAETTLSYGQLIKCEYAGKMDHIEHVTQTRLEYCTVCGDQADGYHYGVLSCRGCNAFFRRAVTYNLQFQCRRGGNCVIDRNARCACRACRLNKCKLAGMDRSAVQIRRESKDTQNDSPPADLKRASLAEISARFSSTSHRLSEPDDMAGSVSSMKSSPHSDYVIGSPESAFTPIASTSTIASSPRLPNPIIVLGSSSVLSSWGLQCTRNIGVPSDPSMCYLNRMVEEYFDHRRRRRSMLCSTLEELLNDDCEMRLRDPAGLEDLAAIYKVQMILMFEWIEKLEEFHRITSPHDKARLLRSFSMKYLLLDNIFHTIELNYSDRLVLVNNTFIQPGILPVISHSLTIEEQRALTLMYGDYSLKILDDIIRPLVAMNITFGEILALRLIIFWNPGSIGLCQETCNIIQKASERTIQELHIYFDENKMPELKTRLASVLVLLSPLAKHTQHLIDITSQIPNFGVLPEWDSFMNDLLR
ncbi:zinc finger, c4 type (two domains) domain-containing protein [Ditylenchus destructor]|nr:zinc finger, c4 type (two domains) domain-containing protein [Ditylenchus destructor]